LSAIAISQQQSLRNPLDALVLKKSGSPPVNCPVKIGLLDSALLDRVLILEGRARAIAIGVSSASFATSGKLGEEKGTSLPERSSTK